MTSLNSRKEFSIKTIFLIVSTLALAGCSMFETTPEPKKPLTFSDKKNCAPKAYEMMKKRDEAREKRITLYEYNQLQTRIVDFLVEKEDDLQSCYKNKEHEYYACAIVSINSKAKIDFLDVSDEVNKLDPEIKTCLENKLKGYNYKTLKAKQGTKFTLPLKLSNRKPASV